jgi:hypothetical protein
MQPRNAVNLMDDPLVGCGSIFQNEPNCHNFLRAVMLRIRLFYSESTCEKISDQIFSEAKDPRASKLYRYEYIINETVFEFREAKKFIRPYTDTDSLNTWTNMVMDQHGHDYGIEFFIFVKTNRENREKLRVRT